MKCRPPFQMVEGLGCIWLYWKTGQKYKDGVIECNRKGGDVFEFSNFDQQQQKLFEYLFSSGGN